MMEEALLTHLPWDTRSRHDLYVLGISTDADLELSTVAALSLYEVNDKAIYGSKASSWIYFRSDQPALTRKNGYKL